MEDGRSQVLLAKVYSKMDRPDDAVTSLQQVTKIPSFGKEWGWVVVSERNKAHTKKKDSLLTQLFWKISQIEITFECQWIVLFKNIIADYNN